MHDKHKRFLKEFRLSDKRNSFEPIILLPGYVHKINIIWIKT